MYLYTLHSLPSGLVWSALRPPAREETRLDSNSRRCVTRQSPPLRKADCRNADISIVPSAALRCTQPPQRGRGIWRDLGSGIRGFPIPESPSASYFTIPTATSIMGIFPCIHLWFHSIYITRHYIIHIGPLLVHHDLRPLPRTKPSGKHSQQRITTNHHHR